MQPKIYYEDKDILVCLKPAGIAINQILTLPGTIVAPCDLNLVVVKIKLSVGIVKHKLYLRKALRLARRVL